MEKLARILNKKKQARILDVGTGTGNFVSLITSCYRDYKEIVGIDTIEGAVKSAEENFDDERIHFEVMDALNMSYPDNHFDVVCLSNSLHHLVDPKIILKEMKRVLKDDGVMLIAEMMSNDLTKKQLSHLKIHHFAAKIDRLRGEIHKDTFSDSEIIQVLKDNSELKVKKSWVLKILRAKDDLPDRFKWFESTVERLLKRVPNESLLEEYSNEGKEIVDYIKKVGFDSCPTLIVVMGK